MIRQRLPLVLSATALAVALLGATPLGEAAGSLAAKGVPFAQVAGFASDAGKLNGHKSSKNPTVGQIPVVGSNGKLPSSIGAVGAAGPPGAPGAKGDRGLSGYEQVVRPTTISGNGSNNYDVDCPGGKSVLGGGWDLTKVTNNTADVVGSQPKSNSVWTFRVTTPTTGSATISLYLICANVS